VDNYLQRDFFPADNPSKRMFIFIQKTNIVNLRPALSKGCRIPLLF
jgi:hypothetical protein